MRKTQIISNVSVCGVYYFLYRSRETDKAEIQIICRVEKYEQFYFFCVMYDERLNTRRGKRALKPCVMRRNYLILNYVISV